MAKRIRHYSKKLRRHANDRTTTRHIVVEAYPYGALHRIDAHEFRPGVKESYTPGHEWHRVSLDWFLTAKEAISAAESV
jgi:hypothetical protein